MKKRILIVDDDSRIQSLVKESLEEEGFMAIMAFDSKEAIEKAHQSLPDLILLDIVLPGSSGWEICRALKNDVKTKNIPVIFMTGTSINPNDKVRGLEIGAFDYVTKPFHSGELMARVKAVLRRGVMQNSLSTKRGADNNILTAKNIILDLDSHTVKVNNKNVELRPKEFDLLVILLRKRGRVLSRRYLTESIWGQEFLDNSRTVDMTIRRLREKLGGVADSIITIQTLGYKFV